MKKRKLCRPAPGMIISVLRQEATNRKLWDELQRYRASDKANRELACYLRSKLFHLESRVDQALHVFGRFSALQDPIDMAPVGTKPPERIKIGVPFGIEQRFTSTSDPLHEPGLTVKVEMLERLSVKFLPSKNCLGRNLLMRYGEGQVSAYFDQAAFDLKHHDDIVKVILPDLLRQMVEKLREYR
jgi:hypothetical protein